jgi:hypothetical protein
MSSEEEKVLEYFLYYWLRQTTVKTRCFQGTIGHWEFPSRQFAEENCILIYTNT